MHLLAVFAQIIIVCSIVFVWGFRFPNVVREFQEYGLSDLTLIVVGGSKIVLAALLFVAIWYPAMALVPALLMACLMACALIAHKVANHRWQKYVPAASLMVLSLFVADVHAGSMQI